MEKADMLEGVNENPVEGVVDEQLGASCKELAELCERELQYPAMKYYCPQEEVSRAIAETRPLLDMMERTDKRRTALLQLCTQLLDYSRCTALLQAGLTGKLVGGYFEQWGLTTPALFLVVLRMSVNCQESLRYLGPYMGRVVRCLVYMLDKTQPVPLQAVVVGDGPDKPERYSLVPVAFAAHVRPMRPRGSELAHELPSEEIQRISSWTYQETKSIFEEYLWYLESLPQEDRAAAPPPKLPDHLMQYLDDFTLSDIAATTLLELSVCGKDCLRATQSCHQQIFSYIERRHDYLRAIQLCEYMLRNFQLHNVHRLNFVKPYWGHVVQYLRDWRNVSQNEVDKAEASLRCLGHLIARADTHNKYYGFDIHVFLTNELRVLAAEVLDYLASSPDKTLPVYARVCGLVIALDDDAFIRDIIEGILTLRSQQGASSIDRAGAKHWHDGFLAGFLGSQVLTQRVLRPDARLYMSISRSLMHLAKIPLAPQQEKAIAHMRHLFQSCEKNGLDAFSEPMMLTGQMLGMLLCIDDGCFPIRQELGFKGPYNLVQQYPERFQEGVRVRRKARSDAATDESDFEAWSQDDLGTDSENEELAPRRLDRLQFSELPPMAVASGSVKRF